MGWIDRLIRLALFVGLFLGATCADAMADRAPELPVRVIKVTMAKGALGAFSEQLRKFADANAFALRIAQSSPDASDLLVQMWREDIKGVGVNSSESGAVELTYSIAFYRNCNDDVPEWAFKKVVAELKKALSETEGVTSLEEE